MKKLKKKIIDVTSDILSAPAVFKHKRRFEKAQADTNILNEAKQYEGMDVPTYGSDGKHTRPFMVKVMAKGIKFDLKNKKKKL